MQNYRVFLSGTDDMIITGGDETSLSTYGGEAAGDTSEGAAGAGTATTGTTATGTATSADGGIFGSIWIWIIYIPLLIGLYFLMTRGQRKREKQMKEMQSNMKTGDNVVTAGGFFGRIADVGEDCYIVEFGVNRGIRIPIQKSDVIAIRSPKMTPVPKEIETKEK